MRRLLIQSLFLLCSTTALGANEPTQPSPQELEEWFQDDERFQPYDTKDDDATLNFLATPPAKQVPHSRNIIIIPDHALHTGWVEIDQCHEHLDPISAVEIVYWYKEMRGLRITSYKHIGKAWVEGQSVQLEDVEKGATLCIQAEARILYKQADGRYILRNGPFQRRFLDSYFPMHVSLTIRYPDHLLTLSNITPVKQAGFDIIKENSTVHIDSWFKGKLFIVIELRTVI